MRYISHGNVLLGILDREVSRVWAEGEADGRTWLRIIALARREMRAKLVETRASEGRIHASSLHGGRCLEVIHGSSRTETTARERVTDLDLARVRQEMGVLAHPAR